MVNKAIIETEQSLQIVKSRKQQSRHNVPTQHSPKYTLKSINSTTCLLTT